MSKLTGPGPVIKRLRQEKGFSINQMERLTNIPEDRLREIEERDVPLHTDEWLALSDALDVAVTDLIDVINHNRRRAYG